MSETEPSSACFDLDVLRTFVHAVDLGGFARAARRVGRSQSAVSLQMRRLEDEAGQLLFEKAGRSFALTAAGERMLGYARRLLALNDEAVAAMRGTQFSRPLKFGMPADFAETWLPGLLARFARSHPSAQLEVVVDRNLAVLEALDHGRLDLALVFGIDRPRGQRLVELPMAWIARRGFTWRGSLPLVMFEAPCAFRTAALEALDRAGIRWHVAYTSQSLRGVWAAVEAGLGVTVRTRAFLPGRLHPLGRAAGLPALPSIALWLHDPPFPPSQIVGELRTLLAQAAANQLTRGSVTRPGRSGPRAVTIAAR